ncbi:hypothetical protein M2158_004071 [Streptomyces sp. SAI-144]|jgi:hypothetical protein|uniref:hypothetical protein n=1 Tax=Streptomyces sp. SAI-144 TaxID=2940544 RepID=UPI00247688EE|nr:hypothetical protein [Streptomyces sp. SAI-144]MDH6435594.1 hypothetical protein [Streptomyces sp. SAI-144]
MTAPPNVQAPRSAAEAAHLLAQAGHHVHVVSDGHSTCFKGCCEPAPLELPAATRARAQAVRLSLASPIRPL